MDINIFDSNFQPVGILDVFDSIVWSDRYGDLGTFELYSKVDSRTLSLIRKGYYISIKDSDQYMVVETVRINSDVEDGDKLIATGRTLVSVLDRRIVWDQTNLTGNFQDAIEQLLNENLISPIDTDRQVDIISFEASTDPIITAETINEQFYGDNLLEAIKLLCYSRGIGFKFINLDGGQFKFKLYVGVNRSFNQLDNPQVIFSPDFDNLIDSDYLETVVEEKTVALVLGEGEGVDRVGVVVESSNGPGSGLSRKELFADASDISATIDGGTMLEEDYADILASRGFQALSEATEKSSFGSTVEARVSFVYGKDFFLGDIVQAKNEYGIEGAMQVTEVVISEDASGSTIFPTFEMI